MRRVKSLLGTAAVLAFSTLTLPAAPLGTAAEAKPPQAQPLQLKRQPPPGVPRRIIEIEIVIQAQIDAFKKDDSKTAFAFASPTIQRMFGTPDRFMDMVKRGYPQIYRADNLKFLPLDMNENGLIQRVLVKGEDGSLVTATYSMVLLNGLWRINGCTINKGDNDI